MFEVLLEEWFETGGAVMARAPGKRTFDYLIANHQQYVARHRIVESRAGPTRCPILLELIRRRRPAHCHTFVFEYVHKLFQLPLRECDLFGWKGLAGIFAKGRMLIVWHSCFQHDVIRRERSAIDDADNHFFK